ncbi:PilZ domain-containing protein [Sneathiella sp.]|uniref:PilZ domain-containing protein n=1 Tax=Sneathiella sp. TaxID=1964365 RepID=UPI0039E51693
MANFFTVGKYRPHNRRDHRHELPCMTIQIGAIRFDTYDWSLGGFRIDDYRGRPPVGEVVRISELSYSLENSVSVDCRATVTRIILGKNQVAFAFNKLDEAAFDFLEKASMQRLTLLSNAGK